MNDRQYHLLICTVGGSPEPIIASIHHWNPVRVLFVPSEKTKNDLTVLTQELQPGGWDKLVVGDAQDFGDCVRQLRGLDEQVEAWRQKGPAYDVIVDFTSGTKIMSAALSSVSRRWHCKFSYVGGTERTKDGIGIVVSGTERTLVTQNPWNARGYQAIEDACLLFDQQAFTPAAEILDEARKATDDDSVRRTLSTFHQLCEGYGFWDRFRHRDAIGRIDNVIKNSTDLQAALGSTRAESVVRVIKQNQLTLQQLLNCPKSRAMVADLLANASRRKREARYDDGVARLYRAIESLAQLALAERHGIPSTDDVGIESIPESLHELWRSRTESGTLRIGLQDAYELLNTLGDKAGNLFKELALHDRKRSPLAARNQSILAHGFTPVGESVFERLWDATIRLGDFSEEELPVFPCLAKAEGDQ